MDVSTNLFSLLMQEGCQFEEQIGSSPMGKLYSLTHPEFGSCVLKHFDEALTEKQGLLEGNLRFLEKLKQFDHPNLAKIHHWQCNAQDAYILRELVVGASLQQYLKFRDVKIVETTQIVLDIAMGLLAGYPFGIVYKNIKPTNIILRADKTACLVDISMPPCDPNYIVPEQWQGKKSDIRSDIYAIGVVYYEMLTKIKPFNAKEKSDIEKAHLEREVDWSKLPDDTSGPVFDILRKMLEKDRNQRYRSILPLIGELRETLKIMGVKVKPFSPGLISPKTDEIEIKQETHEKKKSGRVKKRRNFTTMMVAQVVQDQLAEEPLPEPKKSKTANEKFLQSHLQNLQEKTKAKMTEVILTAEELTNNPEQVLNKITHIEKRKERRGAIPARMVYFPRDYEYIVIQHLQKTFRRETWLLKDSDTTGEMEVEIDLEQAYILRHFYQYEDSLQQALEDVVTDESMSDSWQLSEEEDSENRGATVNLNEEDIICLQEDEEVPLDPEEIGIQTVDLDRDALVEVSSTSSSQAMDTVDLENFGVETINDITIKTIAPKSGSTFGSSKKLRFRNPDIEVIVDFDNAYQTMGWVKFVRKHNLKKGLHFEVKKDTIEMGAIRQFVIHLQELENFQREQENISRIKEFFEGDYDIIELDRGGMGVVLKLTAKNDPTFLSLRPENYWARQCFKPYLSIRKDRLGKEIIFAEIPKGMDFVVKVAFEGYEESLIQEAQVLSKIAEDPNVCNTVIGAVQQGRLFALDEKSDQTRIGYYIMLEYAQEGNAEQFYLRFPNKRIPPTVAFAIMYGMVQTLCKLQEIGMIHRDIKPHNILLDKDGIPKLSDFGLTISVHKEKEGLTEERRRLLRIMDEDFLRISRMMEQKWAELKEKEERMANTAVDQIEQTGADILKIKNEISDLQKQEQERAEDLKSKYRMVSAAENATKGKFAGSLHYAAPEQLNPESILTPKCDVYQLGAVMFTLLTGKRAVEGKSTLDIMSKIMYAVKPEVSDFIKGNPLVDALSRLINRMMTHDPIDRIDIEEVRSEMGQILFDYALELKEPPSFEPPENLETHVEWERWNNKITFALSLHEKCMNTIFSIIFHDKKLPELRKDVEKIVFVCKRCGKRLHVYRHMNGKKGNCPKCGKRILIQLAL